MIKDAGFTIQSDHSLDDLINKDSDSSFSRAQDGVSETLIKGLKELRPHLQSSK
jgi:hypothetical protein